MGINLVLAIMLALTGAHSHVLNFSLRPVPYAERPNAPTAKDNEWTVNKVKALREEMKIIVHEIGAMLRHVDIEFNKADRMIPDFAQQPKAREFRDQFRKVMEARDIWYSGQKEDLALTPETSQQTGELLTARAQNFLTQLNALTLSMGGLVEFLRALPASERSDELEVSAYLIGDQVYNARDRMDRFVSTGKFDTIGKPAACNVNESIRRLLVHFTMTSGVGNSLNFEFSPSDNLPLVSIDPGLVTEIWSNLIRNASEAVEQEAMQRYQLGQPAPGKVNMEITTMRADNSVLIVFTDNGPGIPPENLAKVFELFFTTKEEMGGTGIGLSLVRQIVESAGGTITVGPHTPKGARFMIMLPALPSPVQPPSQAVAADLLSGI